MTKQEKIEAIRLKVKEVSKYNLLVSGGVTAFDILRALPFDDIAIAKTGQLISIESFEVGNYRKGERLPELDISQTLTEWNEETINKLYELFYE